jgi:hypothetical protein
LPTLLVVLVINHLVASELTTALNMTTTSYAQN